MVIGGLGLWSKSISVVTLLHPTGTSFYESRNLATSVVPLPPTALQSTCLRRRCVAGSLGARMQLSRFVQRFRALCLPLLVVIDNTIVNVAIPTFSRATNASTTGPQ